MDKGLSRSKANWEDFAIPTALREQVDVVWDLISQLAEEDVDDMDTVVQELEAARAAYVSLYEDSEAIAQSSIAAGPRKRCNEGQVRRNAPAPGGHGAARLPREAAA